MCVLTVSVKDCVLLEQILQLFEEPEQWLEMQIKKEGHLDGISLNGETESSHFDEQILIEHSSLMRLVIHS